MHRPTYANFGAAEPRIFWLGGAGKTTSVANFAVALGLLGFTTGTNFVRVATVVPRVLGQPEAVRRLDNIDLDEISQVGPCVIGIEGMAGA